MADVTATILRICQRIAEATRSRRRCQDEAHSLRVQASLLERKAEAATGDLIGLHNQLDRLIASMPDGEKEGEQGDGVKTTGMPAGGMEHGLNQYGRTDNAQEATRA